MKSSSMKQNNSVPVPRMKALLFVSVFKKSDSAVSEHAVTIHQEQLDARRSPLDLDQLVHKSFIGPRNTRCPGVSNPRDCAAGSVRLSQRPLAPAASR